MPSCCIATRNSYADSAPARAAQCLAAGQAEASERLLDRVADPQAESPDALAQAEADAAVRRAVEALPEKHRQVVQLRFFEDASLTEIAAALRLSVGTVKSRLHHALEKLRRMRSVEILFRPEG